jgi:magnesium chelatase family protein
LLDRFDLVVAMSRPDPDQLLSGEPGESTASTADRVRAARARAAERIASGGAPPIDVDGAELLAAKLRAGDISARGLHKVARVARTVADLAGDEHVKYAHVADALSLRTARSTVVA